MCPRKKICNKKNFKIHIGKGDLKKDIITIITLLDTTEAIMKGKIAWCKKWL
jgi:hypothetical protein